MTELELLKQEWDQVTNTVTKEDRISSDYVRETIQKKSLHALEVIRRHVMSEVIMTLLPLLGGIVYLWIHPETPELLIYLAGCFSISSLLFYGIKFWFLRPSAFSYLPIKEALEKSLRILTLYQNIYIVSGTLFVPIVAGVGVLDLLP